MVCAFVTNQLLYDQTSSSSSSPANDDSESDAGLVTSLVDALYALDNYQQSTSQVTSLSSPSLGSLCFIQCFLVAILFLSLFLYSRLIFAIIFILVSLQMLVLVIVLVLVDENVSFLF